MQAPQEDVREAVSHLLTHAAVTDLTIEDPPLEEVMRELFTQKGDEGPGEEAPS